MRIQFVMNTHFFVNTNKNVRAAVVARLLTLGKFWEMVTFMTTIYFHKTSRRLGHLPEGGHRRGLGRAREGQRTRDDVLYRQTLGVRRELWLAAADRFWTVTDRRVTNNNIAGRANSQLSTCYYCWCNRPGLSELGPNYSSGAASDDDRSMGWNIGISNDGEIGRRN